MNIDIKYKMNAYLKTIGHTTPEERGKLRSWIKKTGTAYGNPWDIYEESGRYMDYISAMRVIREMQEDPAAFYSPIFMQSLDDDDEEVPFESLFQAGISWPRRP